MKILKINSQHRRDFWANLVCEHCGHIETNESGYDDHHFHRNVIPQIKCKKCGKVAPPDYKPMRPKYDAHVVV